MKSVGVRELKAHASEILRDVRHCAEPYLITLDGELAAILRPVEASDLAEAGEDSLEEILAEIDRIAELVGRDWPDGVSAAELSRNNDESRCMAILDASFLTALYVPQDAHRSSARTWFSISRRVRGCLPGPGDRTTGTGRRDPSPHRKGWSGDGGRSPDSERDRSGFDAPFDGAGPFGGRARR